MHDVDGLNSGYARLLLDEYLENPDAVSAEWRALFESGESDLIATLPGLTRLLETARNGNGSANGHAFAAPAVRGDPKARQKWAVDQVKLTLKASANLGLKAMPTFSGAFVWPFMYSWPPRPPGLIETGFDELAKRWKPIFDYADEVGIDVAFELHPGEDLHDGVTFEMLLGRVGGHKRCGINYDPSHFVLQQLDYLDFIDIYHERIFAFHVKDAEFNPTGRQGAYGGFQSWLNRVGRFRSLGDGQVDFGGIFSKLAQYDYDRWAVLEWECCIKSPEQGAAEGAPFIAHHIINVTARAFDDFAGGGADQKANKKMLGIG